MIMGRICRLQALSFALAIYQYLVSSSALLGAEVAWSDTGEIDLLHLLACLDVGDRPRLEHLALIQQGALLTEEQIGAFMSSNAESPQSSPISAGETTAGVRLLPRENVLRS